MSGRRRSAARGRGAPPDDGECRRRALSLGEGDTPLVALPRLGARIGLPRLRAKLEGCNPTGSYKDRVAVATMALALGGGASGWIATSSGNAATSLAAYGARASLRGLLCVVPGAPREKVAPAVACGATVVEVRGVAGPGAVGTGPSAFDVVAAAAGALGLHLAVTAHAHNPGGMRGAEGIGAEIVGSDGAPDVVYVPTGGGGLVAAVARGLRDHGGAAAVVAAQPLGCAPIVGYLAGTLSRPAVAGCSTRVSGLQLPVPPDGHLAADRVRASGGWGTAVPDDETAAARRELAVVEGVFVEPASAVALAAARADLRAGRLDPGADVVLVLTATGLKDVGAVGPVPLESLDVAALPERIRAWAATAG